ncbi:hypothetical protein KK120_11570 [Virgibacillus dakarensis]|nr:hypothetical protein [Virgibacillus dakarensis]
MRQKRLTQQDASERNAMEGKRSYGLGRISACLRETSETVIALQFLVMNLEKVLRDTFLSFFRWIIDLFNSNNSKKVRVILNY